MPIVTDWYAVFNFLDQQSLLAVCSPFNYDIRMDQELLLQWIGIVEQIKNNSLFFCKRTVEVCEILEEDGFRCCVLKGRGNAQMYPNPLARQHGDIDVWVDEKEKRIENYVRTKFPNAIKVFKHIKYPVFDDVEVDLHQTPLKFRHSLHQRRLQKWIEANKKEQFEHKVCLAGVDRSVNVPTVEFNAVYLLGHIMIHLLDEGIGLRHFVDYYYVLTQLEKIPSERREKVVNEWKELGMLRLASAVIWIEQEVFGVRCPISVDPDERMGKFILADSLEGGNFGQYSKKQELNSRWYRWMVKFNRLVRLAPCFPGETIFRLMYLFKSMVTKKVHRLLCRFSDSPSKSEEGDND